MDELTLASPTSNIWKINVKALIKRWRSSERTFNIYEDMAALFMINVTVWSVELEPALLGF